MLASFFYSIGIKGSHSLWKTPQDTWKRTRRRQIVSQDYFENILTLWVHCKPWTTLRLTELRVNGELMVVAAAISGEWDVGRGKYRILHSLGKGFMCWASLVAQMIGCWHCRRSWVRSLDWKDYLENGKPLHYSCLKSHHGIRAWRATVHGSHKESAQLSD